LKYLFRSAEYQESAIFRLFCGTWNVNSKTCDDEDISLWILPDKKNIADVFVIAFEEIVDLNTYNVVFDDSGSAERCSYWISKIDAILKTTGERFVFVFERHLVGMAIIVFVRESILNAVTDVRGASAGVGVMGVMGNKGGVAIRMNIFETSMCFICSHFAASRGSTAARNNDFRNVLERLNFPPSGNIDLLFVSILKVCFLLYYLIIINLIARFISRRRSWYQSETSVDKNLFPLQHDMIFWLGDFNYRIEESLTLEQIYEKIETEDWEFLRDHDQLNIERQGQRVFQGFEEGIINFPPTYKYQPGTELYERRPGKKKREPAWCDRILWMKHPGLRNEIRQHDYRRAELLVSDHKPVSASFDFEVTRIDPLKERFAFAECMRTVDKWENDLRPKVELNGRFVDFPNVSFLVTILKNNLPAFYYYYYY